MVDDNVVISQGINEGYAAGLHIGAPAVQVMEVLSSLRGLLEPITAFLEQNGQITLMIEPANFMNTLAL